MQVAIVDYGSGNLHSAAKAFDRAALDNRVAASIAITADPEQIGRADYVVLPGVGAFADCYTGLGRQAGLIEALHEAVVERARPFLGICVGMQLLATRGLEHGVHRGLDWLAGEVAPIQPISIELKVPHMGWNTLTLSREHPLFEGIPGGENGWHAYFVHSYEFKPAAGADVLATTDYGGSITAAVVRGNIAGTQFHPEKSQRLGLKLIANFLRWRP